MHVNVGNLLEVFNGEKSASDEFPVILRQSHISQCHIWCVQVLRMGNIDIQPMTDASTVDSIERHELRLLRNDGLYSPPKVHLYILYDIRA